MHILKFSGASLFLIFLLGVPLHSFGAPLDSQILARIRDYFIRMAIICDEDPGLDGLAYLTKRAFVSIKDDEFLLFYSYFYW